jgi:hypothetical protein
MLRAVTFFASDNHLETAVRAANKEANRKLDEWRIMSEQILHLQSEIIYEPVEQEDGETAYWYQSTITVIVDVDENVAESIDTYLH